MTQPNFFLFGALVLLRLLMILTAWIVVPVGILLNQIHKGLPERPGQWTGASFDADGKQVLGTVVPTIVCRGFWKLYDMPDEPGIGLYEKTVSSIYRKYGWWVTVFYQLAFRNIAQGLGYAFRAPVDVYMTPPQYVWTKFGIRYGYKRYADWRAMTDTEILQGEAPSKFYYVPDFLISEEDAQA